MYWISNEQMIKLQSDLGTYLIKQDAQGYVSLEWRTVLYQSVKDVATSVLKCLDMFYVRIVEMEGSSSADHNGIYYTKIIIYIDQTK